MGRWNQTQTNYHSMSNSNLPKFGLCLFPISIFWLCLFQNPSYYEFFICQQAEFFMSISKGLIPNSILCLIPKVLLQCLVFEPSMSNSKGLPTPIQDDVLTKLCHDLFFPVQYHWFQRLRAVASKQECTWSTK